MTVSPGMNRNEKPGKFDVRDTTCVRSADLVHIKRHKRVFWGSLLQSTFSDLMFCLKINTFKGESSVYLGNIPASEHTTHTVPNILHSTFVNSARLGDTRYRPDAMSQKSREGERTTVRAAIDDAAPHFSGKQHIPTICCLVV